MSCEEAETISAAVATALAGPRRVRGDAGEVEQHSVSDLIAADRYARAKCAAGQRGRGLRITKLLPPGTA